MVWSDGMGLAMVRGQPSTVATSIPSFVGPCYEKALDDLIRNYELEGLRLAHGTIEPLGHSRIKHACVTRFRPASCSIAWTSSSAMRQAIYVPWRPFLNQAMRWQVARLCLANKHSGPWHLAAYDAPLRVSESPLFRTNGDVAAPEALEGPSR